MSRISILSAPEPIPEQAFQASSPRRRFSTGWSQMHMPSPDLARLCAADRAACRRSLGNGSKSFAAASLLLPGTVREAATALYAFCRVSDDLVDEEGGADGAIAELRGRLARAYEGDPDDDPVDRAFAEMVARFSMPRALPEALIDGLAWDVAGVVCESVSDLYAYAARVAGSVGAMMAVLMETRSPAALARACDLGVAMQLTNIARDVGADARAGRLYLPRVWLREAGIDPEVWLREPVFTPSIGDVVTRLLALADQLYRRADAGIYRLPLSCRPAIFAARHIYREIGCEVARRGHDSVSARARVTSWRKVALIGKALAHSLRRGSAGIELAPIDETAYLVAAAAQPGPPRPDRPGPIATRLLWAAELLLVLEARRQA